MSFADCGPSVAGRAVPRAPGRVTRPFAFQYEELQS